MPKNKDGYAASHARIKVKTVSPEKARLILDAKARFYAEHKRTSRADVLRVLCQYGQQFGLSPAEAEVAAKAAVQKHYPQKKGECRRHL